MATNLEGLYGIRDQLNTKGITNDRIGWDTKTGQVKIDGQNFLKADTVQNGTSYANADQFNQAYSAYDTNQRVQNTQQQVDQYMANPTTNSYDAQVNTTLKQMMDKLSNPTTYDPYSSAEYAAYEAQAQRGANQSIRTAQESLGGSGVGRSSLVTDRAQNIQNGANEYMQLQIVPQLMAANQQKEQQELANLSNMLGALSQQQGVYDNRSQLGFDNLMSALGISTNQQLRNDSNSQWQQGFDADQGWKQKDYEINMSTLTGLLPDGTKTTAEQQRQLQNEWAVADQTGAITPTLANMYGLKAGTPTRAAKEFAAEIAISKQNANTSAFSARASASNAAANTALNREKFNYDKTQDAAGGGNSSKDPKYNYKNDPVFFKAMQTVNNIANPQQALNELQDRAEEFYDTFGYEAYNTLLKTTQDRIDKQAKAAEKLNPYSQFGNF